MAFSFLVGSSPGPLAASLEQEAAEHGDLVLARVEDHYENLGLKTISAMDWVARNCPQAEYLLKVDDDMFVQVNLRPPYPLVKDSILSQILQNCASISFCTG